MTIAAPSTSPITVTSEGDLSAAFATTGADLDVIESDTDAFFVPAYQDLLDDIINENVTTTDDTTTHYAGTALTEGGTFDITGTNLNGNSGTGVVTALTYIDAGGTSSFSLLGHLTVNNSTGEFTGGTLTAIVVHTPSGAHSYAGTGLTLDLSDSDISFSAGTIKTEEFNTADATLTLTGSYAAATDVGTITQIDIEGDGGAHATIKGSFDAFALIDGPDGISSASDFASFFASDAGSLYFGGKDTFNVNDSSVEWHGFGGNDVMTGGTVGNTLFGDDGNDTLLGNGGDDVLNGGIGNDTMNGGTGDDSMTGGDGNDTYTVDSTSDSVTESLNQGTDLVNASVDYTLGANVENLTLTGTANLNGTGNNLVNVITGNAGNNILDGGANISGIDTLVGGAGNDTYIIHGGEKITDTSGNDTVVVNTDDYVLQTGIENVTLLSTLAGGTGHDLLGNTSANVLTGNEFDNSIDGRAGADTMTGGAGNDTYFVDNIGDVVIEQTGEGVDNVTTTVSFALGHTSEVENVFLAGSGNFNLTGSDTDNQLTGNAGNNTLNGGAGDDVLNGGLGNDTYIVDSIDDSLVDGGGTDTVISSVDWALGSDEENLTLTNPGGNIAIGNTSANIITGGAGDDTLDGIANVAGLDTLAGGAGNDVFHLHGGEKISDTSGNDTVVIEYAGSYTLATGFENLQLNNGGDFNLTGNTVANSLTGGAGNNTLDGKTGADIMIGGDGNDTYVVDNAGDVVTEASGAGAGIDTEIASVSATIGLNVEILTLTGKALAGFGSTGVETINGNASNNTLDGIGGDDILLGGKGNDIYFVHTGNETITENLNEGTDTIFSAGTLDLHTYANVENLTLAGAGTATGTDGANVLTGSAGNDLLLGNAGNDTLTGNGGIDTLDGGIGADRMSGGTGDDTYFVDNAKDIITEGTVIGSGTDSVSSSVTYTLAANLENLTLTGASAINGTGNTLANTLHGNSAVNTLNGSTGDDIIFGGGGNDRLTGGTGNDTFHFATGANATVTDFGHSATIHDHLDISDIITGYDFGVDTLSDFVKIETVGNNVLLEVNTAGNGTAGTYETIATLTNAHAGLGTLTVSALEADGTLITHL